MTGDFDDAPEPARFDNSAIAALGLALGKVPPSADARQRMRGQMMAMAGLRTTAVRAHDVEWKPLLPGVMAKTLRRDRVRDTQSQLLRLEPGARIGVHHHRQEEECLILDGEVTVGGQRYATGDYLLVPPGGQHGEIVAPDGALLFIRGEALSWKQRLALVAVRWWRR
jgi:quercetin dioxygenase-like cupin family protein